MKRRAFIQASMGLPMAAAGLTSLDPLRVLRTELERSATDTAVDFDVIVLGVGSMGSSTCFHLAKQGIKVLGLEQFDIPHDLGSHAGQSRIIRKAYFEAPEYVPLLERAYRNWADLEHITGEQVYFRTGLLYFGHPGHSLISGMHRSASSFNIPFENMSSADTARRFPQFNIPDDYEKLLEQDAGFVTPERAILLYTEQALLHGAVIRTKEKVIKWERTSNGVLVVSSSGTFTARKLVITAGPWAVKQIPGLNSHLNVTRQMLAWVKPRNWKAFEIGNLPCWTIADGLNEGIYYGFPILPPGKFGGPIGFKLAFHHSGTITDPDTVSRIPTAEDESPLVYALNKFFPEGYESTLVMKTCMYTNTPDGNFILDFLPGHGKDIVVATGFSGHGFKFASVIGEIMADLAMKGTTELPIGFLNASRFK